MPRIPKAELYPPGGFSFTEPDGTVHASISWSLVIAKVRDYRQLAKLAPGNPEEEVFAQVCDRHPDLCGESVGKPFVHDPKVKLGLEVLGWIAGVAIVNARQAIGRVSEDEAKRRAAICRACPCNLQWQSACANCGKSLDGIAEDLARPGPEVDTSGLYGCMAHGQVNSVAVRLKLPVRDNPVAPTDCWRRSEA